MNDHSGTKMAQAENFIRPATAPEMSAGVMAAKVMPNTNSRLLSKSSIPFNQAASKFPNSGKSQSPEANPKPTTAHRMGTMPRQYRFMFIMLSTFFWPTMPP